MMISLEQKSLIARNFLQSLRALSIHGHYINHYLTFTFNIEGHGNLELPILKVDVFTLKRELSLIILKVDQLVSFNHEMLLQVSRSSWWTNNS